MTPVDIKETSSRREGPPLIWAVVISGDILVACDCYGVTLLHVDLRNQFHAQNYGDKPSFGIVVYLI